MSGGRREKGEGKKKGGGKGVPDLWGYGSQYVCRWKRGGREGKKKKKREGCSFPHPGDLPDAIGGRERRKKEKERKREDSFFTWSCNGEEKRVEKGDFTAYPPLTPSSYHCISVD